MKISETNLAYLAGIIDSEGTITIIKKLNHAAGCQFPLGMTPLEIKDRIDMFFKESGK